MSDYASLIQPTRPSYVLKKIAKAMHGSTDFLLFEEHERGPSDAMALQFEAVSQLPLDDQKIVQEVLESLIIKYQARRWDLARDQQAATK